MKNLFKKKNLSGAIGTGSNPSIKPIFLGATLFFVFVIGFLLFSMIDLKTKESVSSMFFNEEKKTFKTGNLAFSNKENESEYFDATNNNNPTDDDNSFTQKLLNNNNPADNDNSFTQKLLNNNNPADNDNSFTQKLLKHHTKRNKETSEYFDNTSTFPTKNKHVIKAGNNRGLTLNRQEKDPILERLLKDYEESKKVNARTSDFINDHKKVNYVAPSNKKNLNDDLNQRTATIFNNLQKTPTSQSNNKPIVAKKKDAHGCVNDEIYIEYLGCQAKKDVLSGDGEIVLSKVDVKTLKPKDERLSTNTTSETYLEKGYKIQVILTSQITSQFAGHFNAISTNDVYDATKENLLIPKGSIFYGNNEEVTGGYSKDRMQLIWTDVKINNNLISLKKLGSVDVSGKSGVAVESKNNYGRLFVTSMLVALVGAGIDVSSDDQFTDALNKQLTNTSNRILDKELNAPPKFEIKEGTKLNIVLNERLYF